MLNLNILLWFLLCIKLYSRTMKVLADYKEMHITVKESFILFVNITTNMEAFKRDLQI